MCQRPVRSPRRHRFTWLGAASLQGLADGSAGRGSPEDTQDNPGASASVMEAVIQTWGRERRHASLMTRSVYHPRPPPPYSRRPEARPAVAICKTRSCDPGPEESLESGRRRSQAATASRAPRSLPRPLRRPLPTRRARGRVGERLRRGADTEARVAPSVMARSRKGWWADGTAAPSDSERCGLPLEPVRVGEGSGIAANRESVRSGAVR
jgi:hypothetical protein